MPLGWAELVQLNRVRVRTGHPVDQPLPPKRLKTPSSGPAIRSTRLRTLDLFRNRLEPRQLRVRVIDHAREHLKRSHPDRLPIFDRPVHGEQLFRLGVMRHAEKLVLIALEVAIEAWHRDSLSKLGSFSSRHARHLAWLSGRILKLIQLPGPEVPIFPPFIADQSRDEADEREDDEHQRGASKDLSCVQALAKHRSRKERGKPEDHEVEQP